MSLSQFLLILRARRKIIVYTILSAVTVALLLSLLLPNTYKSVATVVVNLKGIDPVSGFALPAQLLPGYMATQVDIITSKSVALKVVDDLKLAQQSKFKEKFARENNAADSPTGSPSVCRRNSTLRRHATAMWPKSASRATRRSSPLPWPTRLPTHTSRPICN